MIDDVRREHGYHRLTVKAVVQETADTRSFVLDVPDDLRGTFAYRPGQFCTFRTHVDGAELLRCYSMSSAPETDADLTVTVKRVVDGKVSNWFNDHVAEGDMLEVTRPAGVFCPRDGDHPVVALCGGSGVTPVISIAKSVLATTDRSVDVLYANRDQDSVIFRDALDQLQEQHPDRLTVRHHFDSDGGFLDSAAVAAFAKPHLTDADFYLCGPGPFMDLVEATLLDWGVDADRILLERFVTPSEGATSVDVPDPAVGDDASATGDTDVPTSVTIILNGKRNEIAYQPGDTVLETARRGGLQPPFSCEAGNCATCMAIQHDGTATLRANTALTPEELAEGWILTCQALPHGPEVTVEYEAF